MCCLIHSPYAKVPGVVCTVRVAVEARDREPCVWGVSRASARKKGAPRHSCCPLGSDSERSFFSQCQSRSAGEGGREGGKEYRRAVGEAWEEDKSCALCAGDKTEDPRIPARVAAEQGHRSLLPCFLLVCGIWRIPRTGSPTP